MCTPCCESFYIKDAGRRQRVGMGVLRNKKRFAVLHVGFGETVEKRRFACIGMSKRLNALLEPALFILARGKVAQVHEDSQCLIIVLRLRRSDQPINLSPKFRLTSDQRVKILPPVNRPLLLKTLLFLRFSDGCGPALLLRISLRSIQKLSNSPATWPLSLFRIDMLQVLTFESAADPINRLRNPAFQKPYDDLVLLVLRNGCNPSCDVFPLPQRSRSALGLPEQPQQ